ncbi:MAG: hypothetical protein QOD38_461 [Acidimicrobiaceae bacterium]
MVRRHRLRNIFVAVALVAVAAGAVRWVNRDTAPAAGAGVGTIVARLVPRESLPRDLTPYAGLGTWVDGFDFGPAYTKTTPPVTPSAIDDMAANGVKTLYLQAVRDDSRSPEGVVDRALVAEFLIRAHRRGLRVVGWYLPKFTDLDLDFARLQQIADFDVLGHRFDGVAVDIEDVQDVTDVADRNQRLIDLSTRLRAASGGDALGAIVLPPVLTEVVNKRYWPDFPYPELHPLYDVWLPMSYWTFRSESSGYHDGYTYNDESTRRLRSNLGDGGAVVHAIGGIGDLVTTEELDRFAQSLVDDRAVGGSIYDWSSMTPAIRAALAERFATGAAAHLPAPG